MINNRTKTLQSIWEKVAVPSARAKLDPDTGEGWLSQGFYRGKFGINDRTGESFWEGLIERVGNLFHDIFHVDELQGDEILLDVYVRTPQGTKMFPNLPLHANFVGNVHDNSLLSKLQSGPIQVKVIYDGGRPSECVPIAWKTQEKTAADAELEVSYPGGGFGPGEKVPATPDSGGGFGTIPGSNVGKAGPLLGGRYYAATPLFTQYQNTINQAGHLYGYDANLIAAIIINESAGNPLAHSPTGAQGLMQLEPGTFDDAYRYVRTIVPGIVNDAFDPRTNIFVGSYFLQGLIITFQGKPNGYSLAIASYNAGPGAIKSHNNQIPPYAETQNYVRKVLKSWGQNIAHSTKENMLVLDSRPETLKQDKTKASKASGLSIGGSAQ